MENENVAVPKPNYWNVESNVSGGFNRLKGKLYNLVEATITDKQQCEAIKGLIRGFANSEYSLCVENMRYDARNAGFINKDDGEAPMTAEPLELN